MRVWLFVLTAAAIAVPELCAQDYRAKVQGVVTDASQAAVAGAKVTLANAETGVETVKLSNPSGQYIFDYVEPGNYRVVVEHAGFGRFVDENVVVQVRGDVTVNARLKVGSVQETVTVTDQAIALQFNTSTMSIMVDRKMLDELPVEQRNPFTLALLLDPAAVNHYTAGRYPFYMWASSRIDVGGSTDMKDDLQLDGAPLQLGQKGSYSPPMDALQEFAVQQNAVDAEFGHSAGGVLSLGMKSGTNEFHGTAYYFGKNPAIDAVSNSVTHTANLDRNHIWGGTLGNPIRRNKLFTFTAYEGWKTKDPLSKFYTLPTQQERTGDYSQSFNINGGLRTVYDPWTTQLNTATNTATRTPFPGNIIPTSRMDATSLRMLKDVWLPNSLGDDITHSNNFKAGYSSDIDYYNFSNRTDWNISDKWKVFGRYSRFRTQIGEENYSPNDSAALTNGTGGAMNSLNIAADTVYTLNPTTVINGKWSYGYLNDDYSAPGSQVGAAGLQQFWPNNAWYSPYIQDAPAIYYPALIFPGNTAASPTFGKASWYWQHPHSNNLSGKISKNQGRHYLKFGSEGRFLRSDAVRPNLMSFSFSPSLTANTFLSPNTRLSGDAWAAFLLGALDNTSQAGYIPRQKLQFNFYALYFNDDFKLSRRLTLTLGLRWEYESGPRDPQDRLSRYVDLTVPIPEMQSKPPNMPADVLAWRGSPWIFNGAWSFTDGQHQTAWQAQKTDFMPRAGLAFRVNDKTVLRAGFARYIAVPESSVDTLGSYTGYSGFDASTTVAPALNGVPQAVMSNPFPSTNPLILPVGKAYGAYTNLGGSASFQQQAFRTPVSDRINVSFQHELRWRMLVDATYYANFSRNLTYTKNLNVTNPAIGYQYKTQLNTIIANPFYQYLTPNTFPGQLRNQATVTKGSLLGTYPQYSTLQQLNTSGMLDHYQSVQVKVQRAFAAGYTFMTAYNYSREKGYNFFNDDDTYANRFTWLDSLLPRHRLSAAGTYNLPFGKGRQMLSHAPPVVDAILGGWSLSGVATVNSGNFLRFGAAVVSGNPILPNPTLYRWFDITKFTTLPSYTMRTNPWQYEGLTGPRNWNLDSSLSKFFRITERMKLEFRMESYNLSNTFIPTDPVVAITNANFGRSINQSNKGREFQYTARLHF